MSIKKYKELISRNQTRIRGYEKWPIKPEKYIRVIEIKCRDRINSGLFPAKERIHPEDVTLNMTQKDKITLKNRTATKYVKEN